MKRFSTIQIEKLRLAKEQTFSGECGLALVKALLQSGVGYVGCSEQAGAYWQDVFGAAQQVCEELGVDVKAAADEAGAAATLTASVNHPLRGAVILDSASGINLATNALSHVAASGVKGGALIVSSNAGDASNVPERSHAMAMKSQIWLLDPRPNLPSIVDMVGKGFQLSEASNTPVMLELRAHASQMHGSFTSKDNRAPKFSLKRPPPQLGRKGAPPPSSMAQEKHKADVRRPAALKFIREQGLNEFFEGRNRQVGIILQGGLYNTVIRALQELGLADTFGASSIPLYVLNVTYPLVPEEVARFCSGKRAVLVVEEGQPNFIEEAINSILRRADLNDTYMIGKDVLPMAGEYSSETVLNGIGQFLQLCMPDGIDQSAGAKAREGIAAARQRATALLSQPLPSRAPELCAGGSGQPVFSALRQLDAPPRFGIDEELCTSDRDCIRLLPCPSLTLKDNPDPLRTDPVATIDRNCTGFGTCGDVAHAALQCPSFYKAEPMRNAGWSARILDRLRRAVIGISQGQR